MRIMTYDTHNKYVAWHHDNNDIWHQQELWRKTSMTIVTYDKHDNYDV